MTFHIRTVAFAAVVSVASALPASAADTREYNSWAVNGSVGVVDDGDVAKVALNERTATFKPGVTLPAKAIVRYHLPAGAMGLWGSGGGNGRQFIVRFLDSGDGASVKIKVKRASWVLSEVTTVWDWTSDTVGTPSTIYRDSVNCSYGVLTDFNPAYTYWVELELNKSNAAATVGFSDLVIQRELEC